MLTSFVRIRLPAAPPAEQSIRPRIFLIGRRGSGSFPQLRTLAAEQSRTVLSVCNNFSKAMQFSFSFATRPQFFAPIKKGQSAVLLTAPFLGRQILPVA